MRESEKTEKTEKGREEERKRGREEKREQKNTSLAENCPLFNSFLPQDKELVGMWVKWAAFLRGEARRQQCRSPALVLGFGQVHGGVI